MSDNICPAKGEVLPEYAQPGDAGADLRSSVDEVLPPRGRMLISTGVSLALPENCVGLVWPRSGMAVKKGIDCGAGVIDSGYRGEIKVLLFNHSDEAFPIKKGDRIAQLLVQKVERVRFKQVEELPESDRGAGGFGSTGNQ